MGCLDVEQTELGQNGGLSQSCLQQNWSKTGQPACPVLCKYNKKRGGLKNYTDSIDGDRVQVHTYKDPCCEFLK